MDALRALDPVAYVRFASVYRNFREARDFEEFISDHRRDQPQGLTDDARGARAGAPVTRAHLAEPGRRLRDREGRSRDRPSATREGGRPHAEADAIAHAEGSLAGATVYVTLEPCSHHGRTPPCADALVAAGVARVVSALEDPDPRVKGQGHARLRAAGIAVEVGEGAEEAAEINAGFLLRVREGRPLFRLKLASSLDGRIATASGRGASGSPARPRGPTASVACDA